MMFYDIAKAKYKTRETWQIQEKNDSTMGRYWAHMMLFQKKKLKAV